MSQKILVIEDDRTTADFIVKSLTGEGFVVDHAADGRDGLFHATDGSYDAIVLDRMLPGMDGMAVLAALRAAKVATPVIILSNLGAVDARVEGLTSGASDYLVKPFAFSELLARLKLLLAKPSGGTQVETMLACEDLEMNLLSRRVTRRLSRFISRSSHARMVSTCVPPEGLAINSFSRASSSEKAKGLAR